MTQQRRKIPIRRKLLYSALIAMIPLVAVELGLRWAYQRIERITGVRQFRQAEFGGLTYHWDRYHHRYGWTNVSGYQSDERVPFKVTINQQGLRASREYAQRPPAGRYRIAVLGDSCTFGEEVNDDQTLPFYLERQLTGCEVLNFGVHGFGLGQMALRLEDEVFAFSPHHIVVNIMIHEDVMRTTLDQFVYNKPVFSIVDSKLHVDNLPVPEASQLPWIYRHSFTASFLFGRPRQHVPKSDQPVDIAKAILRKMSRLCRERKVRLTILVFVSPHVLNLMEKEQQWRDFNHQLGKSLGDMELDVLNEVSYLERVYAREGAQRLAMPAGHWSPRGNRLIARRLAGHLAAQVKRLSIQVERDGKKVPRE